MTTISPFAPYANSLLRFQIASGELLTDPKTGNKRPGTAIAEVVALLEQKKAPKNNELPGVDDTAVWVEGFLVTPRPLPEQITPESQCFGTWQGREGRFHLTFTARNPYIAALGIDLVEKIRGYFQFTNQIPTEFIDFGGGLSDFGGLTKNVGQLDLITAAEIVPESDRVYVWDASETGANRSKAMVFSELENYLQPTDGGVINVPFSYGDASPKPIALLPANTTIFTATIVITASFNGVGAALTLGDADVGDRLISASDNAPSQEAEYETNPGFTYSTATQILLTINPGAGATSGAGYVLLEV